ncbi:MAG TPA: hypothetical protein VF861_08530 [Telluria sp.]
MSNIDPLSGKIADELLFQATGPVDFSVSEELTFSQIRRRLEDDKSLDCS